MPVGPKPQPLDGWLRLALEHILDGTNESTNIYWLQLDAGEAEAFDETDSASLFTQLGIAWSTNLAPLLSTSCRLSLTKLVLKRASGEFADQFSSSAAGSVDRDVEAANVCVDVNWNVNAFYRGGHPRTQYGGVPIGERTNSRLFDETYIANWVSGAHDFHVALNGITTPNVTSYEHFIPSFQTGGAWRTPPIHRGILSVSGRRTIGTMRKRLTRGIT
jgi:hypothetical protein